MNEFERKLYLKYRNIENMRQLLCLKLYRLGLLTESCTTDSIQKGFNKLLFVEQA